MRNPLVKAASLFRRKKYAQVIALLEPALPLYRQSFRFYYLLGMSCIYRRDWNGGYSYIKSAYAINETNIYISIVWATLLIRNREFNEGLSILLNIVDRHEFQHQNGYKQAKRLLNAVKKCGNEKDVVEEIDKNFSRYLPLPPFNYFPLLIFSFATLMGIFLFLLLRIAWVGRFFSSSSSQSGALWKEHRDQAGDRGKLSAMTLNENEKISDFSNQNRFEILLTDKQIQESFRQAKKYLETYNDNYARKEINQLLLSNASFDLKEKAKSFARLIKEPKEMRHFDQGFTFEEVHDFPQLYNRCFVKWQGRITSIKVEKKGIFFDFLVGYQDRKKIDGIVSSRLDFEMLLNEEYAYEMLARVEIDPSYQKEIDLQSSFQRVKAPYFLHVVAIRRIEG